MEPRQQANEVDLAACDPATKALLHLQIRDYFSWLLATTGQGKGVLEAMELEFPDLTGAGTLNLARVPYLLKASRWFGNEWQRSVQSKVSRQMKSWDTANRKRKGEVMSRKGPTKKVLSSRKRLATSEISSMETTRRAGLTSNGKNPHKQSHKDIVDASVKQSVDPISGDLKQIQNAAPSTPTGEQIAPSSKASDVFSVSLLGERVHVANKTLESHFVGGIYHQSSSTSAIEPAMTAQQLHVLNHQHLMQQSTGLQGHDTI